MKIQCTNFQKILLKNPVINPEKAEGQSTNYARGRELAKCRRYYISLCSKLVNEGLKIELFLKVYQNH